MTMRKLEVRFDGPGVHPGTIDALRALEVVTSYLALVSDVAHDEGQVLHFTGIDILDECTLFAVVPSDPSVAETATRRAKDVLQGSAAPPHGAVTGLHRCREALTKLPKDYTTTVIYGGWKGELAAPAEGGPRDEAMMTVSLRATPIRVGGREPKARFESKSETQPFTLDVTREQARQLGAALYQEVDIVALVVRVSDGPIRGKLHDLHRLETKPALEVWEEWFQANAAHWDDVEEVERELGRDGS